MGKRVGGKERDGLGSTFHTGGRWQGEAFTQGSLAYGFWSLIPSGD